MSNNNLRKGPLNQENMVDICSIMGSLTSFHAEEAMKLDTEVAFKNNMSHLIQTQERVSANESNITVQFKLDDMMDNAIEMTVPPKAPVEHRFDAVKSDFNSNMTVVHKSDRTIEVTKDPKSNVITLNIQRFHAA